jgi:hypothetical protein
VYWYRLRGAAAVSGCAPTPLTGCVPATTSSLTIRSGASVNSDRVQWNWTGTEASDSEDAGPTDYITCTYTSDGGDYVLRHASLASGTCWISNGRGWSLAPPPDGGPLLSARARISRAKLKSRHTGGGTKRTIRLLARQADAIPPELPLSGANTVVQFVAADGRCWEDRYTDEDVVEDSSLQFRAKRRQR